VRTSVWADSPCPVPCPPTFIGCHRPNVAAEGKCHFVLMGKHNLVSYALADLPLSTTCRKEKEAAQRGKQKQCHFKFILFSYFLTFL
jgi:hypothetical protein